MKGSKLFGIGLAVIIHLIVITVHGQQLITNVSARKKIDLNGKWKYIIDPYETGFYNYRWQERDENDPEAYWNTDVPANKTERREHGYSDKYTLRVPGDWNSQDGKFLYYEGTVWYKRSFDFTDDLEGKRAYLCFGAVNYRADVYLNGRKLGMHKGGFTPFNFQVPRDLMKEKGNFLVVKVDNRRSKDEIPTINTDWWNYGGITRDVSLIVIPNNSIVDYSIQLDQGTLSGKTRWAYGWVKMSEGSKQQKVVLEIPELKVDHEINFEGDSGVFRVKLPRVKLWTPEAPKLYAVKFRNEAEEITDQIGFRSVEVRGSEILLNGASIFLRGICTHEEIAPQGRRATSRKDAVSLFGKAIELNANMVRLAHYPHNENMTRVADSLGLLIWSEIPVYWTIDFTNPDVLRKAKAQLSEMITRDRNRASIIIWSVGNETPVHEARTKFMTELVKEARRLDDTRLISAALEVHTQGDVKVIDDPLGEHTDIVAVNEYIGWYGGLPSSCRAAEWQLKYDKPLFFSETGAEALTGFHADILTRWSEEYQEWYYKEQIAMMKRMPKNYVGLSPWILVDFRSPRRNNPYYQEGWNNKGLFGQEGEKKKAFFVLKNYYDEVEQSAQSKKSP